MQIISTGVTGRNQSLLNGRRWIGAHTHELCVCTKLVRAELRISQEDTTCISCTNTFPIYKQLRQLRMKLWTGDLDSACIYSCRHVLRQSDLFRSKKLRQTWERMLRSCCPCLFSHVFSSQLKKSQKTKTKNFSVAWVKKKKKRIKEYRVHFFKVQRIKVEECPVFLVHISLSFRIPRHYLSLQEVQKLLWKCLENSERWKQKQW